MLKKMMLEQREHMSGEVRSMMEEQFREMKDQLKLAAGKWNSTVKRKGCHRYS